jgi:cyclopropane fatty-acyl-phospholipid synthase-like methyltransferase
VTELILDKEGKFLLPSALSAIFKINQKKNLKKKTVSQIFPSIHLPSFIQISSAVSEKQVRESRPHTRTTARPHARTRVKIISYHSFAWQLNDTRAC